MGAAARRKGFGSSRPAAFGGRYADCRMRCWQTNGLQTNGLLSVNPETLYFNYWHNLTANAPRSPVRRPVPIPDKLSHRNSEGTNRLQNAQWQCSRFDGVTVTRSRSTVTLLRVTVTRFVTVPTLEQRRIDILGISGAGRIQNLHPQNSTVTTVTRSDIFQLQYAAAVTSSEAEKYTIALQFFCVLHQITTQSVREILAIEFLIQQVAQIRCRAAERLLLHHEIMNSERENIRRCRFDFIAWSPSVIMEQNSVLLILNVTTDTVQLCFTTSSL